MESFSPQRHRGITEARRGFLCESLCHLCTPVVKKILAIKLLTIVMKPLKFLFALALVSGWISSLSAQPLRFELGQRTRAMEIAWDAQPSVEARKRASAHLKQAVTLFFAFKLSDAVKQVDHARFTLQSAAPLTPQAQWAESLFVLPESRLLDRSAATLAFTLDKLYPTMEEIPKGAVLQLSLSIAGKAKMTEFPLASLPLQEALPLALAKSADGDFTLLAKVVMGKKVLASSAQTISVVSNLNERIAKLKPMLNGLMPYEMTAETMKGIVGVLDSLANKKTLEANFPAARLLAEVEAAHASAHNFYGNKKIGQFWLTFAPGQGIIPVRILAPAAAKAGKPLPLVIALHGAGGSENMFFETYGAGAIAKLCEQRGWLLVSPRGTGMKPERVAELIDAMDKLYPVDRSRVFVVGHSMGGGQTAAAANLTPEKFAGVAVLGGGGAIRNVSEALQNLPFFIGIGTEDFALRGAKALHDALQKANVKQITYREYPEIEHLAIVQVALKDVFAFFDGVRK
jgi:pimeloyl-ACP methyl ester carboxylesterase